MTRRWAAVLLVVGLTALAACSQSGGRDVDVRALLDHTGSTDQGAAPADASSTGDSAGTVAASGAGTGAPSTGSRTSSGATATASLRAGSTTATGTGGTRAAASGPPIQVGVFYPNDGGAAYAAFGVTSPDSQGGDPTTKLLKALQAITDDINRRGGLGGRKMELVLHGAPLVTGDTWSSQGQAACSDFTEDHKVFAALLMINGTVSTSECLAGRHVIVLESRNIVYDKYEYQKTSPYTYSARGLNLSRQGPWLEELSKGGYFDKGAKVGVVTIDDTMHSRSMDEVVRPTLRAHGITVTDVGLLTSPQATADAGTMGAQTGNVILRFKSEGIDHVIFWGSQGVGPFFFPTAAENQGYRPRYGLSTADYPELNRNQAPAAQFARAMGAGWSGPGDVGLAPNWQPSDKARACLKYFSDQGQAITTGDTASGVLNLCDSLWLLEAGMDRATVATPEAFRAAVDGLGSSVASGGTPVLWSPGVHDGAAAVRRFAFDTGCSCFKWASPTWTPAP